jgi:hypothetical protein
LGPSVGFGRSDLQRILCDSPLGLRALPRDPFVISTPLPQHVALFAWEGQLLFNSHEPLPKIVEAAQNRITELRWSDVAFACFEHRAGVF